MKSSIHDASARQHFGEPFSGLSANDARRHRPHNQDLAEVPALIGGFCRHSSGLVLSTWPELIAATL
jgi:hypothetical protein